MITKKHLCLAITLIITLAACKKNPSPKPVTNSNVDVYVVGTTGKDVANIDNFKGYATIWKNGVATQLTSGSLTSYATAIAIYGADVYVAGYTNDTTKKSYGDGCYWKNGVLVQVPNAWKITSIVVNSTGVYLAGIMYTANDSFGNSVDAYWKNGGSYYAGFMSKHGGYGCSGKQCLHTREL